MQQIEELVTDHFRVPVPAERRVGAFAIGLVVFGIGITLPIFYLGAELGQSLGLRDAALVFFGGCMLLGILCAITSLVGALTGLSSYMIIQFPFGRDGAKIVNLLMAIALLGYFGATADIFGQALRDAVQSIYGVAGPLWAWKLAGCALMTFTAVFGFRAIEKLSFFSVPLMALFMFYAVWLSLGDGGLDKALAYPGKGDMGLGLALSTVLGSSIQSAVLAPDVTRFARSGWAGILSIWGLAIGFPLVFLAAAIPSIITGEISIMLIMVGLGIVIPALFTLIFATWTTNTVNLYSTSMVLATVFTRVKEWKITLAAAAFGTTLALLGIMEHFLDFLLTLGITTPPIAGIYLVDFFFLRRRRYDIAELATAPGIGWAALLTWIAASAVGFAAMADVIRLTGVPAVDSLFAAALIYFVAGKFSPARNRSRAAPVQG